MCKITFSIFLSVVTHTNTHLDLSDKKFDTFQSSHSAVFHPYSYKPRPRTMELGKKVSVTRTYSWLANPEQKAGLCRPIMAKEVGLVGMRTGEKKHIYTIT